MHRLAWRCSSFVLLVGWLASDAAAQPPGEVPGTVRLSGVRLEWTAAPGATHHHVYVGRIPRDDDHECFLHRTADLEADLSLAPSSEGLLYFLVSGVNVDGEGSLGPRGADERPNPRPCDVDGDTLPQAEDNCPDVFNPDQQDQDENGVGDRCDPRTYDFEDDLPGTEPEEMTRVGPAEPSFLVRDLGGDLAATHDGAFSGTHHRFDRLRAAWRQQDVTVWLDYEETAANLSLELWSEGVAPHDAGAGVILQLDETDTLLLYERSFGAVPLMTGPPLPPGGRLRARLRKGAGTESRLHVDAWDGAGWVDDHAVFVIPDDRRFRGHDVVLGAWRAGRRALRRITVVHELPAGALFLHRHPSTIEDWKLFQRDADDRVDLPLRFDYRLTEGEAPGRIEAWVVDSDTGEVVVPMQGAELAAADRGLGELVVNVPAGGNYDLRARLLGSDSTVLGEDTVMEIAVGDLFIAGGQSNMAGWSEGLLDAEEPIDEVHLLHPDGSWRRAAEPMDDIVGQVDAVSIEWVDPQHSPMLRFAKDLRAAVGVPIGVVPATLGGSNLHFQWQRDMGEPDHRATLYGSLLHRARLHGGLPPRGLIWFQGESDAWDGRTREQYETDFERLLSQLRSDLDSPELPVVAAQLGTENSADALWLGVQEAQRRVVARDPFTALITTVDQTRHDSVHFDNAGYKTIGSRFAQAMRALAYGHDVDHLVELVEARLSAAGAELVLTWDAEVTGGEATPFAVTDSVGALGIVGLRTDGATVTLELDRALVLPGTVSYGPGRNPSLSWVEDGAGVAVPCFGDVAINP
ncbi:MAG: sialate O-acetylesterase [Acidobacteriota bacterium]